MLDLLIRYFSALWSLFADLWFYMVFGFVLAAAVNEFVSTRRILSYFGGNDVFSLLRATFAGFLVSSCSCGALALASTFRKRGASTATLLTFLLAAPWAGLPMVFVFIRFLGLVYTLLLMTAGLAVAFLSGTILAVLENRRIIEQPVSVAHRMEEEEKCAECVGDAERMHRGEPLLRRVFEYVPLHVKEIVLDIGKYMVVGLFSGPS